MRKLLILLACLIVSWSIWLLVKNDLENENKADQIKYNETVSLPTESFIIQHLLHEDGTIRTDFKNRQGGNEALSESIGLWMEYLAEKEDEQLFAEAFQTIKDKFILNEGLIAWKIEDGQVANTNALIDDIRIMEALFQEGERTNHQDYLQMAKKIAMAVLQYNRQGDDLVDFYDVNHAYANEEVTLSYLNPNAIKYMEKYNFLSEREVERLYTLMKTMPLKKGFYPKYYQVKDHIFHYDDTINLIDQLYIAAHLEKFDLETDLFFKWIKEEFDKETKLYGRYDRKTKEQVVNYESASVYALAIIYSIEKGELTFAKAIYEQMITMRVQDQESIYSGGYLNQKDKSTHSFDNLLPLLAERILINERIIN